MDDPFAHALILTGPTACGKSTLALELAESLGLAPVFETARMYTGEIAKLALERVFGVTTFELG